MRPCGEAGVSPSAPVGPEGRDVAATWAPDPTSQTREPGTHQTWARGGNLLRPAPRPWQCGVPAQSAGPSRSHPTVPWSPPGGGRDRRDTALTGADAVMAPAHAPPIFLGAVKARVGNRNRISLVSLQTLPTGLPRVSARKLTCMAVPVPPSKNLGGGTRCALSPRRRSRRARSCARRDTGAR